MEVVRSGSSLGALHFKVKSSGFAGGLAVGCKKEGSRQLLRGEGLVRECLGEYSQEFSLDM